MRPRTSSSILLTASILIAVAALVAAVGIQILLAKINDFPDPICLAFIVISTITLALDTIAFIKLNRLDRGIEVALIYRELCKQLIDAGCYRPSGFGDTVVLPEIRISLDKETLRGLIWIRKNLYSRNLLDNDLSMSFGQYCVDSHYDSEDGNWHVYEVYRYDRNPKLQFSSYSAFCQKLQRTPDYSLFVDRDLIYPISHTLICGQTGSGKSYGAYSLLLQLMIRGSTLFFVDPKASGLSLLGRFYDSSHTAVDFDEIIDLLRTFDAILTSRNERLQELLKSRIDGDYRSFDLQPQVLVFEEYGAFQAVLSGHDKKERDEVNRIIERIVLLGRQSGCFLFLIAQQVSAATVPTKIRDNIPVKILMARGMETETAVCCFGAADTAEIERQRNYSPGEAYFRIAGINAKPKRCIFPLLEFDLLDAVGKIRGGTP